MTKSWKSFVTQEGNQEAEHELLNAENALQDSLENLAKHNEVLQLILKEREDLEAKMQKMLNPQADEKSKDDPRFGTVVASIDEKRKTDEKRFHQKRSLETKIAEKNKEVQAWEQKNNTLKIKIDKTKTLFERQKKRIEDFQKKTKKLSADFDYDKERERVTYKIDDFPFTEKKFKKKHDDFSFKEQLNKHKEKVLGLSERLKNQPQVKKIKDEWERVRELEREVTTIKHQFEQKQKKNLVLKNIAKQLIKINTIKEIIAEKKIEGFVNQEKKEGEKKEEEKKKNLLERLNAKKEEWKEKKVKEKGEEPKEKKSQLEKREDQRRQRKEEKSEKETNNQSLEKKALLEKLEERQHKRREEQNAEDKETAKREQRREQRQEERKSSKKDKFNY